MGNEWPIRASAERGEYRWLQRFGANRRWFSPLRNNTNVLSVEGSTRFESAVNTARMSSDSTPHTSFGADRLDGPPDLETGRRYIPTRGPTSS